MSGFVEIDEEAADRLILGAEAVLVEGYDELVLVAGDGRRTWLWWPDGGAPRVSEIA